MRRKVVFYAQRMRLRIRGYRSGELVLDETVSIHPDQATELAERHARILGGRGEAFMVEFEFLDEPNPMQRFFRFGTDTSRMVEPIGIRLQEPN